jgi:hypothetical protein
MQNVTQLLDMVDSIVSKFFSIKIRLQIKIEIKHFKATLTAHAIEFN